MATQHITIGELRKRTRGSLRAHEQLVDDGLRYLWLNGVPAMPVHTGPRVRPRPGGGFDLKRNTAQLGLFDILASLPPTGRLLLVDMKTGGAKLSTEQRLVRDRFTAAGALCLTARSIADLERGLRTDWISQRRIHGGNRS